jgi:hypothetical protein
MAPDRHRLGECGAPVVETVGHLHAHAGSESHQVGVRAVVDVGVRTYGLHARRGERDRQRRDEIADPDRRTIRQRAQLEHLSGELVAHDVVERGVEGQRRTHLVRDPDELGRVMQRMQVGAADTTGLDRDQGVTRTGNRVGDVVDDEYSTTGDGGAHARRLTGNRNVPPRACVAKQPTRMEPKPGFTGLEL